MTINISINKTTVILIAILVAVLMFFWWYIKDNGSAAKTNATINSIEQKIDETTENANKIVEMTKKKEATVREKVNAKAGSLTDDELCNAINSLLQQYRNSSDNNTGSN